jgi:hypothetical protein
MNKPRVARHGYGWGVFLSGRLEEWYIDWIEAVLMAQTLIYRMRDIRDI